MKKLCFLIFFFAFNAQARPDYSRFWDHPESFPADLNRVWIETQGNCVANNRSIAKLVKSRSSTLSLAERGMSLSEMLDFLLTTPHFPRVNSLDFRNATITHADLVQLNKLTPRMNTVTDIYLGGSSISDKRYLINFFLVNLAKKIEILDLRDANLDSNDMRKLSGVIGKMHNLRVLYLGNNKIGDSGFNNLMNGAFKNLQNLQILSLKNNGLTEKSLRRFAMFSMPRLPNLQIIDLKKNNISKESATLLMRTSFNLNNLSVLDLGSSYDGIKQSGTSSFLKCNSYSSEMFANPN